jgi:hypothetical protein
MLIDYQVYDFDYRDYACFKTLEEAKDYIDRMRLISDDIEFRLYKRERIEY